MQRKGWDTNISESKFGEYLHMQERGIKNDSQVSGRVEMLLIGNIRGKNSK